MVVSLPYTETQHVSYIFRISALLAIMQRFWLGIEIVQHLSSLVTEWSWAWDLFCNDGICSLTYSNIMHQTIKCWEMLAWDLRYWRDHVVPQFTNPIHNRVKRTIIKRYQDKYSIFQITEWVFSVKENSQPALSNCRVFKWWKLPGMWYISRGHESTGPSKNLTEHFKFSLRLYECVEFNAKC